MDPLAAASPETRLLLCAARVHPSTETIGVASDLLAKGLDGDRLIANAERHSIIPLLDRLLSAVHSGNVPASALDSLKKLSQANTGRCLLLSAELVKIDALFRERRLISIPYKGPVIAAQAYGNIALRQFDDLDIISPQRDIPAAHEVLVGLGYEPKFPVALAESRVATKSIPGEYKYHQASRDIIVELHTEFTLRHFPVIPNFEAIERHLVTVPIVGEHQICTFAPEHALPFLCIHGSKDFWDRLSWIADISELIRANPSLDWDQAFAFSASLQAQRMTHLGLLIAHNLLEAPLPPPVISLIQRDKTACAVAAELENRLLTTNDSYLDSAAARFAYRRRMVSGHLAGWQYAMRLAFAPSVEEWQAPPPTASASPFSTALRPVRMLQKHGWTPRRSRRSPS
jgi:hypothetical protein